MKNPALSQIIQWNEEGTGFMIANSTEFSAKVLPLYFKHSNMHSYIRQLNMYGFSKKHGKNSNYYHHPHFLRGQ